MSPITHLSADWRRWIAQNLARGCDPQTLIADMVRKNFDAEFARVAVLGLATDPAVSAVHSAYVYEAPHLPRGNLIATADRNVRVAMRLERPCIAIIDDLLGAEECDELVRRSRDKLQRSTTVDPTRGTHEVIADRSSYGTFFALNADAFIATLDRRIATVMNWPIENGEGLQILHYPTGGEYTPHFDYFPPGDPGSQVHLSQGGQRVASLVMYLNDVEDGGATVFPELRLTVGPKKGAAVYFEYCNRLGQVDPMTLHGGMPVLRGEKWIATKWMRQRRYGSATVP